MAMDIIKKMKRAIALLCVLLLVSLCLNIYQYTKKTEEKENQVTIDLQIDTATLPALSQIRKRDVGRRKTFENIRLYTT